MSVEVSADCVLLDIEGTTSSISFVHDEMFPFARDHARQYLVDNWQSDTRFESLQLLFEDVARAQPSLRTIQDWLPAGDVAAQVDFVDQHIAALIEQDSKSTGLKNLQGRIWKQGFESGQLKAHVYDDVPGQLRAWKAAGIDLRVYSSGSIAAQKLFFQHSTAGSLLDVFSGHYDTTTGAKQVGASYEQIANEIKSELGCSPGRIVFVSDVVAELRAAATAGLQCVASVRPGNAEITEELFCPEITSFRDLHVSR